MKNPYRPVCIDRRHYGRSGSAPVAATQGEPNSTKQALYGGPAAAVAAWQAPSFHYLQHN